MDRHTKGAATVLEVKSDVLSAPSSRASWEGGADSAFGFTRGMAGSRQFSF